MALIKCPECGKEFSDTATTCPHCGYSLIPFVAMIVMIIGGESNIDFLIGLGGFFALLSGACNFYVGKFKKGLLFSITCGGFLIGAILDLFRLLVTNNFKDSNNFPVIY